jgi:hypothetical protein
VTLGLQGLAAKGWWMTDATGTTDPERLGNTRCQECGSPLPGKDLSSLKCSGCGTDLPPRLGI